MATENLVKEVITAFQQIPVFESDLFLNRLFNKARNCSNISFLKSQLSPSLGYGPDPDSMFINHIDASQWLAPFAEQAAANSLLALPSNDDKYNFKGCVSQVRPDSILPPTGTLTS
jgi:hypothetical protein